jgi:hypothetical protein
MKETCSQYGDLISPLFFVMKENCAKREETEIHKNVHECGKEIYVN